MEAWFGPNWEKFDASLPQLSGSIVSVQLYMDFLTASQQVKFYTFFCPNYIYTKFRQHLSSNWLAIGCADFISWCVYVPTWSNWRLDKISYRSLSFFLINRVDFFTKLHLNFIMRNNYSIRCVNLHILIPSDRVELPSDYSVQKNSLQSWWIC